MTKRFPGCLLAIALCVFLALTISLTGCGRGVVAAAPTSTTTTTTAATASPTVSITANQQAITSGQSVTLTIASTNANTVFVTNNISSTSLAVAAAGGTVTVSPTQTTTYTVTATGANGVTATQQLTVTVNPQPTITLSAIPNQIALGQSSTLTAVATNAAQVTISDNVDAASYSLAGAGGTQSVTPATVGTYTYTATATNASGQSVTATATVVVKPSTATVVALSANPTASGSGQPVLLTISAKNANSIFVTDNVDSTSLSVSAGGGTLTVHPTQTTTYTATATGAAGTDTSQATVTVSPMPTVTIVASPATIVPGKSALLTITATNATSVVLSDNLDSNTTPLSATGGTQTVSPTATEVYTATATNASGQSASQSVTVMVNAIGGEALVNHVVFMLQENRTFDTYFGMLNPYRKANGYNIGDDGKEYDVDGIDDKLTKFTNVNDEGTSFSLFKLATACVDDMSSDWLASYGDVSRYNFTPQRKILMDGFVHTAENYAKDCLSPCSSQTSFADTVGERAMGYYDETFLNYYYYMASQFAVSDRWFSPVSSKSTPNRIATISGGTTQGLTKDPYKDDKLQDLTPPVGQLPINTIFGELDKAGVSWKIYYTLTVGNCLDPDGDCGTSTLSAFPSTTFTDFQDSYKYVYAPVTRGQCSATTTPSLQAVGDSKNSFCIDTNRIAPLSQYYTDVANGTLPSYAFIEAGYGVNDEHPGNGNSILAGQVEMSKILNAFMNSPSWNDSIFFLSYDEGGGPFDHVPPVPGHTNDYTDAGLGVSTDISSIAVNPDSFFPCPEPINPTTLVASPTQHCDLKTTDPGYKPVDAPAIQGFAAQLGFRLPNMIVSPFTRRHYVSHTPMDHTAVIRFVEDRFIGNHQYLTQRDAAQPNLLEFFDFSNIPWNTPPTKTATPPPTPVPDTGATCNAAVLQ